MNTANTVTPNAAFSKGLSGALQNKGCKKGLSGSTIKLIAIIAMLIDHIAATVLERMIMRSGYLIATISSESLENWMNEHLLLYGSYFFMRMIGRFGFPIFCFLIVEGFMHTRSRLKYAMRLFLFALISEIPFDFAFMGKWFYTGYQNVFFTLFLGLLALCGFSVIGERLKGGAWGIVGMIAGILLTGYYGAKLCFLPALTLLDPFLDVTVSDTVFMIILGGVCILAMAIAFLCIYRKKGLLQAQIFCVDISVLCLAAYAADLLKTDYAGMGVVTIALMYAFRRSRVKSMLAGCISLTVMSFAELPAFLMLIPIAKYNGTRGLNMKYFFYAFYPVHLGLLYLLCVLMGIA